MTNTKTKAPDNPFAQAEIWETSLDQLLGKGPHVVKIVDASGLDEAGQPRTSSNGNPSIELRFENPQGTRRSWEYYHEEFLGKVVALYDSAGIERPGEGEFDPSDHCRLTNACIARLVGKTVGIVVKEEPDNRPDHSGEMQLRVAGYVTPARITGGDVSIDTDGLPDPSSGDDDIPF